MTTGETSEVFLNQPGYLLPTSRDALGATLRNVQTRNVRVYKLVARYESVESKSVSTHQVFTESVQQTKQDVRETRCESPSVITYQNLTSKSNFNYRFPKQTVTWQSFILVLLKYKGLIKSDWKFKFCQKKKI